MRIPKSWILGVAAAATLFVSAACGGGSSNSGVADGSDPNIPEGSPFIDQNALRFIPTNLSVSAGAKVYFKNSETAIHTVTIEGENLSGNMRKDDVFVWTAPTAMGEYQITCDFHPQMKATITVGEPATTQ